MTRKKKQIKTYTITVRSHSTTFVKVAVNGGVSDTKLADRTTALDRTMSSSLGQVSDAEPQLKLNQNNGAAKLHSPVPRDLDLEAISKIRQDLSEAQRSKGEMQARLQILTVELQKLKMQSKVNAKCSDELTAERAMLVSRIRDRDEELRGKAKLLVVSFLLLICTSKWCKVMISWIHRTSKMKLYR